MEKVLEHLLIRKRYSQDITNSNWNLSPGYGILLDEVEGSRTVDLASVTDCIWIRGGKVGKVCKEEPFWPEFPSLPLYR